MLQIIIGESGQEQNDALVERFDRLVNSLLPPGARFAVNPRPNWDYPAPTREQYLSSFGTFTPTPQFRPGAGTLVSPRTPPPAAAGRPPLPAGGRVDPSFNWREELRQTLDRIINPAPGLATYTQVLRLFSSSQAVLFGQGENVRQVSGGIAEQR